jgi:F0F1-type ATP synthase membrane subunit c/vacuolar-type H+-ATPase subunit K
MSTPPASLLRAEITWLGGVMLLVAGIASGLAFITAGLVLHKPQIITITIGPVAIILGLGALLIMQGNRARKTLEAARKLAKEGESSSPTPSPIK